jgi:Zn-dependent membrane protease YugP
MDIFGYIPFFFGFDPTFIILLPAIALALYAQAKVQGTFRKYLSVPSSSRMTGAMLAKRLLANNGIFDVEVEKVPGTLSDHYDPRKKVLRLSPDVYESNSLAALGVAAHETGHAVQHQTGYFPLSLRAGFLPLAQFGSTLAFPLLIIGLLMGSGLLINIGIFAFAAVVLFQVITLPVEFNASSRAIAMLADGGYIRAEEVGATKKVLSAAALTYVAATIMAVLNLVRLLLLSGLFGSRDD